MKGILVLCIFISFICSGVALQCYTCSVGETDTDKTCVDSPEQTSSVNCNKKYCTVTRQEYKDPQDKVASIYRGCEDTPLHMNEIIEDETYRFYYTSCQTDLCNGGTGKAGDTSIGSLGDKTTLIVPGTGGGIISTQISVSILIFFLVVCWLM